MLAPTTKVPVPMVAPDKISQSVLIARASTASGRRPSDTSASSRQTRRWPHPAWHPRTFPSLAVRLERVAFKWLGRVAIDAEHVGLWPPPRIAAEAVVGDDFADPFTGVRMRVAMLGE